MLQKRIFTILLVLGMLLSMTACTGEISGDTNSSQIGVTQEEYDALQQQLEQKEQELEALRQEMSLEKEPSSESQELPLSSSSGTSSATGEMSSASANNASIAPSSSAASQLQPPPQQPVSQQSAGEGPLAKYTVNVLDFDTPAVSVTGRAYNGGSAYVFTDRDDNVVGTIPAEILGTIIRENGLSYAEAEEQKAWFIQNFNLYRGLETEEMNIPVMSVPEYDQEEFAREVIRLTNIEREKAGLEPLVEHETAMEYAQIRAEEIADYFSHDRLNGEDGGMYSHYTFMENIAKGSRTPEAVVEAWMNSPGHRATMMADYSDYGNGMGVGVYRKNSVIYWVQEFLAWDANV